jgi:hypothetical protein
VGIRQAEGQLWDWFIGMRGLLVNGEADSEMVSEQSNVEVVITIRCFRRPSLSTPPIYFLHLPHTSTSTNTTFPSNPSHSTLVSQQKNSPPNKPAWLYAHNSKIQTSLYPLTSCPRCLFTSSHPAPRIPLPQTKIAVLTHLQNQRRRLRHTHKLLCSCSNRRL